MRRAETDMSLWRRRREPVPAPARASASIATTATRSTFRIFTIVPQKPATYVRLAKAFAIVSVVPVGGLIMASMLNSKFACPQLQNTVVLVQNGTA
jgi:hypothetical protein